MTQICLYVRKLSQEFSLVLREFKSSNIKSSATGEGVTKSVRSVSVTVKLTVRSVSVTVRSVTVYSDVRNSKNQHHLLPARRASGAGPPTLRHLVMIGTAGLRIPAKAFFMKPR